MKKQPLLSIITVSYNSEHTIEQTIQSVINQSYSNIEYIIVDGASKDHTVDIIKKYKNHITRWITEPDQGVYFAMNKGIKISKGDYICLLNSDDWFEKDTCKIVAEAMENHEADIYYGCARVINKNNQIVNIQGSTVHMLDKASLAHQTCFIKRSVYEKELYDTTYRSAADYEFECRTFKKNYSFCFIDKILVNYRLGGISDSIKGQKETFHIRYKYGYISKLKYLVHELSLSLESIKDIK